MLIYITHQLNQLIYIYGVWCNYHIELHSYIIHVNNLINVLKRYKDETLIKSLNNDYLNFYN